MLSRYGSVICYTNRIVIASTFRMSDAPLKIEEERTLMVQKFTDKSESTNLSWVLNSQRSRMNVK